MNNNSSSSIQLKIREIQLLYTVNENNYQQYLYYGKYQ